MVHLSPLHLYSNMNREQIIQLESCIKLEQEIGRATDPKNCVNFDQFVIDFLSHLEDEFGEFMSEALSTFDFERWAITMNTLVQAFGHHDKYGPVFKRLKIYLLRCFMKMSPSSLNKASARAKAS